MDYSAILDEMLSSQYYMFLATSSPTGQPWATPICYVRGEKNKLYFLSHNESLHAYHIWANPRVAFSIFDNKQLLGNAFWIQWCWIAKRIDATAFLIEIREKLLSLVSMAITQKEHSFYCIEIDEIYLPDAERWKVGSALRTKIEL